MTETELAVNAGAFEATPETKQCGKSESVFVVYPVCVLGEISLDDLQGMSQKIICRVVCGQAILINIMPRTIITIARAFTNDMRSFRIITPNRLPITTANSRKAAI